MCIQYQIIIITGGCGWPWARQSPVLLCDVCGMLAQFPISNFSVHVMVTCIATMEPVLPFQNVPYDKSVEDTGDISNMSAEEYFSWVRDQSSKMPAFFRASDDVLSSIAMVGHTNTPAMFPMILEIPECPESLLPSANWEREVIHSFSELRSVCALIEQRLDIDVLYIHSTDYLYKK